MKKTIILVALLFAAIFAAGCGEKEAEGDKGVKDLKVALVLTGPINDGGWSQSAYEGLIGIAAKYDAQTAYLENVQAAQYNMSIRNYAKDGYNVIIANGAQFLDAVKEVSAEYPDTVFLVSSTDVTAKFGNGTNVSGVIGDGIEQGFLMGVTAAYLAQEQGSKKVAAVAGVEIPAFKKTLEGYNLGVAYVDKSIQVVQAFTGSTDDVNKLKNGDFVYWKGHQIGSVYKITIDRQGGFLVEVILEESKLAIPNDSFFFVWRDQLVSTGRPRHPRCHDRLVQHGQRDIGQQRRDDPALGCSFDGGGLAAEFVKNSGFEECPHQRHDLFVLDPFTDSCE